jgi:hypothetical protein
VSNVLPALLVAITVSASEGPKAFREISVTRPTPANLLDPTVLRVRPAALNTALFNASAARKLADRQKRDASAYASVVLNFFPDVVLPVRWTSAQENEQGGTVWAGSLAGVRSGQAVLVITGSSVVANITRGDGRLYQIRTMQDGTVWLREIDQNKFHDEAKPPRGSNTR